MGFIFIFPFLLFPIKSFAIQADIKDISDDKYFQAVHKELSGAKGSIYIAMYSISIEPDKAESEASRLVKDIVDAHSRGVNVEVYLDRSKPYNEDKNDSAFLALYKQGVPVKFITPGKRVHDKLIVIDKNIVISGSSNWSYSAFRLNSENADLIISREYAKEKLKNILKRLEGYGLVNVTFNYGGDFKIELNTDTKGQQ